MAKWACFQRPVVALLRRLYLAGTSQMGVLELAARPIAVRKSNQLTDDAAAEQQHGGNEDRALDDLWGLNLQCSRKPRLQVDPWQWQPVSNVDYSSGNFMARSNAPSGFP